MRDIILNEVEMKLAQWIGQARYENARSKGKVDMKIGDQPRIEADIFAMGAEVAFCKMFNVYPDLDTDLNVLPYSDATTRRGYLIDVKHTVYRSGHLLVAPWKEKKPPIDLYCLIIGEIPRYRYCGMIHSEEVFKHPNTTVGKKIGYAVEQIKLFHDERFV